MRGELRKVRFGRRNPYFRPRLRDKSFASASRANVLPMTFTMASVVAPFAFASRIAAKRVRRLARLRNQNNQRFFIYQWIAVPEFACHACLDGTPQDLLKKPLANDARMVRRAAPDNRNPLEFRPIRRRKRQSRQGDFAVVAQASAQGFPHGARPLVDFLEHEMKDTRPFPPPRRPMSRPAVRG